MDTTVTKTLSPHTCTRCGNSYMSPFKGSKGICPDCKAWLKATRLTHCHSNKHDVRHPVKFDKSRDTKYGREYHCPVCDSWINFGLLADVFSVPAPTKRGA